MSTFKKNNEEITLTEFQRGSAKTAKMLMDLLMTDKEKTDFINTPIGVAEDTHIPSQIVLTEKQKIELQLMCKDWNFSYQKYQNWLNNIKKENNLI